MLRLLPFQQTALCAGVLLHLAYFHLFVCATHQNAQRIKKQNKTYDDVDVKAKKHVDVMLQRCRVDAYSRAVTLSKEKHSACLFGALALIAFNETAMLRV